MPVFINAKGTSINQFQLGKRGTKLYGGEVRPTENIQAGEIWLDKANSAITIARQGAGEPVFENLITVSDITKSDIDALNVDAATLGDVAAIDYARTDIDETFSGNLTIQKTLVLENGLNLGDIGESANGTTVYSTGGSISFNSRTYTGNGNVSTFTVTQGVTQDSVFVFLDGLCVLPVTDYTISSTTLTFTSAPADGAVVHIREILT